MPKNWHGIQETLLSNCYWNNVQLEPLSAPGICHQISLGNQSKMSCNLSLPLTQLTSHFQRRILVLHEHVVTVKSNCIGTGCDPVCESCSKVMSSQLSNLLFSCLLLCLHCTSVGFLLTLFIPAPFNAPHTVAEFVLGLLNSLLFHWSLWSLSRVWPGTFIVCFSPSLSPHVSCHFPQKYIILQ